MQEYAGLWRNMQEYAIICRNLQESAGICKILHQCGKNEKMYKSFQKAAKKLQDSSSILGENRIQLENSLT